MEAPIFFLSLVFLISSFIFVLRSYSSRHKPSKLPPGPHPFPILGNIPQLGGVFHRTLAKLSQAHGPLMKIKLGSMTTVVVSSSEAAKQLLLKHDHSFVRRTGIDAARALDHNKFSVVWMPALGQWRKLRKLCKEQMFSTERLNESRGLRLEKAQQLCDYLQQCCRDGKVVNIGEAAFTTSLNLISNTVFSVDFAGYDSSSSHSIKEMVSGVMMAFGAQNVSDFLPILKVIDPQGIRRQAKVCLGRLVETFDGIISQRLKERSTSQNYSRRNDLLETLLDLSERSEAEWSYKDIKHLILDLFSAGTETTSVTVEWAMTELLRNPGKLRKARAEIKSVIGQNKHVQESDISRLEYLQAVVKETYRLHPAVTILGRRPEDNIEINQYIIPKGAEIILNIWAISRDPGQWPDPDSFMPERFFGKEIDAKGQHFELLPFGTGRRICLGMPLAHRMIHLMIATLVHNFDWKLDAGMKPEDLDMSEKFGITVQKAVPLKAIPLLDINT